MAGSSNNITNTFVMCAHGHVKVVACSVCASGGDGSATGIHAALDKAGSCDSDRNCIQGVVWNIT